MQAPQITLELERIVPHMPLCHSRRKDNPGECTCEHREVVAELDEFIYQLLRKIR
jgi:hypothetical protein